MVKLRSGYVYIDKALYNHTVKNFNKIIENMEFKIIGSNICNTYKEIKFLSNNLCIKNLSNGDSYFIYNKFKKYIINDDRLDYNSNLRKELFEIVWINMCELMKEITSTNKIEKVNINLDDKKCLICFDIINKNDEVNICKNNGINHYYHNSCFNTLIKTNNVKNVGHTNYECPYCRRNTINIHKKYIVN